MRRWILRAAVSLTVAAILLWIIPIGAVLAAIGRVSLPVWVASLAVFFAGHYLNAWKLRLLIGAGLVSRSACLRAQYAGLVANLGLPGLAGGDVARAAYLAPVVGARRIALASIADRVIDTLTLLTLAAIALPLAGTPHAVVEIVARVRGVSPTAAIGVVLIIAVFGAVVLIAAGAAFGLGTGVVPRIQAALSRLRTGFHARRAALVAAAGISLSVQSAFVLTNAWLARQVGVTTGLAAWFVAWPLSKLIAVLPISLGGIGVREAALVSLLAPYGAPRDSVLATGILWQGVLTVSGIVGLVVTQWLRRSAAPAAVGPPAVELSALAPPAATSSGKPSATGA